MLTHRQRKENHIGAAHLAPGMTEARLMAIYHAHGVYNVEQLDAVLDGVIDLIVEDIKAVIDDE